MGEIAEGLLNGDFDEITGEYLGDGDGYPRSMYYGHRKNHRAIPGNGGAYRKFPHDVRGVYRFLNRQNNRNSTQRSIQDMNKIILEYNTEKSLVAEPPLHQLKQAINMICELVQGDFGAFVQWCKSKKY